MLIIAPVCRLDVWDQNIADNNCDSCVRDPAIKSHQRQFCFLTTAIVTHTQMAHTHSYSGTRDVPNSDYQYSAKYKYWTFLSGRIQTQILNCQCSLDNYLHSIIFRH